MSQGSIQPRTRHLMTTPRVVVGKVVVWGSEKSDTFRGMKHERCCECQSVEEAQGETLLD
jgi:hypothetical protein